MLNPVPYFFKQSIQSYATLPVTVANASKSHSFKFVTDAGFLPN